MEIVKRGAWHDIYSLGNGRFSFVTGGGISNVLPFDDDSDTYVPERYDLSEAESLGNDIWKLKTGRYGYIVDLANSVIRICPVRGEWKKFVEVRRIIPQPMSWRKLGEKALELFVDGANFRWSFIIWDKGFKVNIRLDEGYAGSQYTIRMGFRLNGLKRQGRGIYDGETLATDMKKPWLQDSSEEPIYRNVTEFISGEEIILGFDLVGLTYPVNIDPTFGPTDATYDARMVGAAPNNNYETDFLALNAHSANMTRTLFNWATSGSIPAGSAVSSASLQLNSYSPVNLSDREAKFHPTTQAWVESGVTYNKYDGTNNWASAGGDFDTGVVDTVTVTATTSTQTFTVTNCVQENVSNGDDVDFIMKWTDEAEAVQTSIAFRQGEYGTAAERPKLTINYISAAGGYYYQQLMHNRRGRT